MGNGAEEVFDLVSDPWELRNIVLDQGQGSKVAATLGPLAEYLWACKGAECHTPVATPVTPFKCYVVTAGEEGQEDSWDP